MANDLDLLNLGGVQQKTALNSDIMRDSPDGKRATKIVASQADYDTFKDLNTLTSALNDFEVDSNGIAGFEFRAIVA
jgi:hypothetical protein